MGVADYLVTSTLHTVLAQRLVRRLCPHCRKPHAILPELARELCAPAAGETAPTMYQAVGCAACHFTGYLGRTVINETLTMTDSLRRLVLQRSDSRGIQEAAKDAGMRPMFVDGVRKAVAGITTLEEVMRVTQES
jgi:general secretion pathway protein E